MDVGAAQEAVKRFCLGLCSLIKNWQRDHPSVSDRDIPILSKLIDVPWPNAYIAVLADIKVETTIADIKLNFGRWKEIMRDPDYGEYVHEPKEGNSAPAEGGA